MRNTLYVIMILTSMLSFGQINKGAKIVDLDFSYSSVDSELYAISFDGSLVSTSFESSALNIKPVLGIALAENQVIYFGADLLFDRRISGGLSEMKGNIYSLVLGYERLFAMSDEVLIAPSFTTSVGFGKRKGEGLGEENESDLIQYKLSLTPTMYYFFNKKWALTGSIGLMEYRREEEKVKDIDGEDLKFVRNNFQTIFGLNSWSLGVRFILNNKLE